MVPSPADDFADDVGAENDADQFAVLQNFHPADVVVQHQVGEFGHRGIFSGGHELFGHQFPRGDVVLLRNQGFERVGQNLFGFLGLLGCVSHCRPLLSL